MPRLVALATGNSPSVAGSLLSSSDRPPRVEALAHQLRHRVQFLAEHVLGAFRREADEIQVGDARALRLQRGQMRVEHAVLGVKQLLLRDRGLIRVLDPGRLPQLGARHEVQG